MFLATRIANGLVALLALLLSALFLIMLPSSDSMAMTLGAQLLMVAIFFLTDLVFRKKNQLSDRIFALLWTAVFSYPFFEGLIRLTLDAAPPPEIGGSLVFGAIVFIFYGVPFLLNGTYCFRLWTQDASQ